MSNQLILCEGCENTGLIPILIPAYRPGPALSVLVEALRMRGADAIIVVDDGSGPEFEGCFRELGDRVDLIRHAVNLGKGAALKTGLNEALVRFPDCQGVVTADADGQHDPDDILRIAAELRSAGGSLVLGVRAFGPDTPWKSRLGNNLTRTLMGLMVGQKLSDTQTGLRGIPARLIPHLLRLASTGYEFEMDMLIACKHQGCPVVQVPIRTIYEEGNRGSHFHPVRDSMRIYFLLFRFSVLAISTAVLDNLVFAAAYSSTGRIGLSQIAGRLVAMTFNYAGARSAVFQSRQRHAVVLPKYVALVICNGLISYVAIQFLIGHTSLGAIYAKLAAEAVLFLANFAIQRDFVFTRREQAGTATDWDRYYKTVPFTAKLTRRYTSAALVGAMKRHAGPAGMSIIEIGGANSCFMDRILRETGCRTYDVVDNNQYGLDLLERRAGGKVGLHLRSVLDLTPDMQADLVFSVGLVEHFDTADTRRAVLAHFDVLRPGGTAIITFPTPTLLYRATRRLIEAVGMWGFPDERPLEAAEVIAAIRQRGEVLEQKILWPLVLTQGFVVARKTGG
jgi:glycosyltransferase involved in cell wall biosynthesis/SAM-dependent methyltransferase